MLDHWRGEAMDGADRRAWPPSAVAVVAIVVCACVLLLALNVLGVQIGGGRYNADVGGSVAEWFGAIATLVAIPAAVFLGLRQLRSATEQLELARREFRAADDERRERVAAERAQLAQAIRVDVSITNVVDAPDHATSDERAAADRWREEVHQRGWKRDETAAAWRKGVFQRTSVELLAAEETPLLEAPWLVTAGWVNTGSIPIVIEAWAIEANGLSRESSEPVQLASGRGQIERLGATDRGSARLRTLEDAHALASTVSVSMRGRDVLGREFDLHHPATPTTRAVAGDS
jgi:hypothetical protein